jgi:hypothetical protein
VLLERAHQVEQGKGQGVLYGPPGGGRSGRGETGGVAVVPVAHIGQRRRHLLLKEDRARVVGGSQRAGGQGVGLRSGLLAARRDHAGQDAAHAPPAGKADGEERVALFAGRQAVLRVGQLHPAIAAGRPAVLFAAVYPAQDIESALRFAGVDGAVGQARHAAGQCPGYQVEAAVGGLVELERARPVISGGIEADLGGPVAPGFRLSHQAAQAGGTAPSEQGHQLFHEIVGGEAQQLGPAAAGYFQAGWDGLPQGVGRHPGYGRVQSGWPRGRRPAANGVCCCRYHMFPAPGV